MADDWRQVQDDLRDGAYGPWEAIRWMLAAEHAAIAPGDGISSSDMNHMAYGWAHTRPPLPADERQRIQRMWDIGDERGCWEALSDY